jgi:hypothetical protein
MACPAIRPSPAGSGVRRWGSRVGVVLLVAGVTVAPLPGRTARAAVIPTVRVTAQNGYSGPEVSFLNYLEAADFELIKAEPDRLLYAAGRDSCAAFVKGDTEAQVIQGDQGAVARRGARMSPAQIGALVPVAVLKLCPAYLPAVTVSVD